MLKTTLLKQYYEYAKKLKEKIKDVKELKELFISKKKIFDGWREAITKIKNKKNKSL